MEENYIFANLQGKEHLVQEIEKLEGDLQKSIGQKVNLIAYAEKQVNSDNDKA